VFFRGEKTGNWFYAGIAIFIVVIILLTVLFSTNTLFQAYIEERFLVDDWIESGERNPSEQLFGLEKQSSFKYIVDSSFDENYTAFLTVTSIKTIFMINEEELLDKTIETILNAADTRNINIDDSSKFTGSRFLKNGHNTFFVVFNGTQTIDSFVENVNIIGETWNCARSGTSIICIGVAQTTDTNFVNLAKILGDEKGTFKEIYNYTGFVDSNGLIFNVKCH
jgi:hypothetical protein